MNSVDIHSLWTLRKTNDRKAAVYVNSIPNYPDEETRKLFYTPSKPDVELDMFTISNEDAASLFHEVSGSSEYQEALDDLPKFGQPYIHTFAINRRVDDRWLECNVRPGTIHITLTPRLGSKDLDYREFDLKILGLSGASRRTVRHLDSGTRRIAYFRYVELWNDLCSAEPIPLPRPDRVKVFISYRRLDGVDIAKALHSRLENYGSSAYFAPFFDLHELKRGEWEERILTSLGQSRVFMPVLTTAFAQDGSFSLKELEIALKRAEMGDLHIAPVFVDGHSNPYSDSLRKYQGCILHQESDWAKRIDQCLDVIARS